METCRLEKPSPETGSPLTSETRNVQAYDQHLNMILGEVEEVITVVEYDEDTYEEHVKVPHHPRFFVEKLGSAVGAIDYVRGSKL